ncbi:DUF4153 domain-containing protein [Rhodobacter calidifons]|uniref:DUF4153 domain-containing protein n=1 Tax=Rhodobacter calidifons TaxID=2715277 RepID=A0ABX0GB35_9RHOB|nr:DUF4153 domain-containing protein [Rhodobacter calidifons]NHB78491.1 DUF4153 domain-containing protein [Rhodobacter calidifons]
MTGQIAARLQLAMAGALGGALLWAASEASQRNWIADYPMLILIGGLLTLFAALLGMAGPIGLARALPRAAGLAAVVAALLALTMLRYATPGDFLRGVVPALAALTVALLPVPFLIAAARSGWRDYPALFLEAWSVLLRLAAAGAFTGLVWLVIYLSDEVLRIVGIHVIGTLLRSELAMMLVTGAVLGLGMAVIHELADLLSPYVVLRLFRLFLPVVLAVMVVFLLALPFRGLSGLTGALSPALLLLTLVGGGIALVSIAVDQSDAEAAANPVLRRSAQAMALILPVLAGLALWAIRLRVADRGWTPDRVFVALVAGIGVGYGLVYAQAVLRGGAWMERIRQGNIRMALAVIALAALWLTPILNAERISAQSQLARFLDGRTPVEALDIQAIGGWGKPGAEAMARLEAMAAEPGQELLARRLSGEAIGPGADERGALQAAVAAAMPVQPASATGTRDMLLDAAEDYMLRDWKQVCGEGLGSGRAGCLMVVADLLPALPGEEAMLFLQRGADYVEITGIYLGPDGRVVQRITARPDGGFFSGAEAADLMRSYQDAPPPLTPALVNQLGTGETGLMIQP